MSLKADIIEGAYKNVFRPLAFGVSAERVHNSISNFGEGLQNFGPFLSPIFSYQNKALEKKVLGIKFTNPIGLAAGFDYDGHMAKVLKHVGFGFNTVGTVTARSYEGNPEPRLARLPKSRSLLVNKGFKSDGAIAVAKRLDHKNLVGHTIGISVGSTNSPKVDTIPKVIDDYLFTFDVFKNKKYVSYFELNISCPNTTMTESFTNPKNFRKLTYAIKTLQLNKPLFVKMPNEITHQLSDELVSGALKSGIEGFIFSNLVKNRKNKSFVRSEINKYKNFKGNFSGKPTEKNANNLIAHTRKKFGDRIAIIGLGGIFSAEDALTKMGAGADLVQLITGMVFEGPQLIGQICEGLVSTNQYQSN